MGHGPAGGAVGLDAGRGAAGLGARSGPGHDAVNERASEAPLLDAERAEAGGAGSWQRLGLSGKARTGRGAWREEELGEAAGNRADPIGVEAEVQQGEGEVRDDSPWSQAELLCVTEKIENRSHEK